MNINAKIYHVYNIETAAQTFAAIFTFFTCLGSMHVFCHVWAYLTELSGVVLSCYMFSRWNHSH